MLIEVSEMLYVTTCSCWFTMHLRLLKSCNETYPNCIWAMYFPEEHLSQATETGTAWNTSWETLSPQSAGGQPLCLQGCHTITPTLRTPTATLGCIRGIREQHFSIPREAMAFQLSLNSPQDEGEHRASAATVTNCWWRSLPATVKSHVTSMRARWESIPF